ncbi:hypothetical protein DFH09DRAFT_938552 [Mycena vulgaris]|nr:hypothetical protein DFH09DRAFT_938552 [Mycena vulgaris]
MPPAPAGDADPLAAGDPPARPDPSKKENAFWSHADCLAMLRYLQEHKSEAGDGCNFKLPTYNKLLPILNSTITRGGLKTTRSCQGKFDALKTIFRIIQDIQKQSGFHWDNETGASITVASATSWDVYVTRAPKAKPYRNVGWSYLSQMELMMPTTAKGNHVFRALKKREMPGA